MACRNCHPLGSLICECYDEERLAAEAIDGVLAQTYSPLEIIIVDDCSSDGTAKIIEAKLAAQQGRSDIHFIRNEKNLTMLKSSARAIEFTTGNLVTITCGD